MYGGTPGNMPHYVLMLKTKTKSNAARREKRSIFGSDLNNSIIIIFWMVICIPAQLVTMCRCAQPQSMCAFPLLFFVVCLQIVRRSRINRPHSGRLIRNVHRSWHFDFAIRNLGGISELNSIARDSHSLESISMYHNSRDFLKKQKRSCFRPFPHKTYVHCLHWAFSTQIQADKAQQQMPMSFIYLNNERFLPNARHRTKNHDHEALYSVCILWKSTKSVGIV